MSTPSKTIDVLGLGSLSIDDFLFVSGYPAPDEKAQVIRRERHYGGLTGTALVTIARLGGVASYAGVLGPDDLSEAVVGNLTRNGVEVSHVSWEREARPIHSHIVVDMERHTRNIFFDLNAVRGAGDEAAPEELLLRSRVLIVDHLGVPGMIATARVARQNSIPVVADFEGADHARFAELLALVDHLVLSRSFAESVTQESEPCRMIERLGRDRTVIVTCGGEGCWVGPPDERAVFHHPAFVVEARDTTGCGDVFHGAYALALAEGLGLSDRLQFASAAAALKAVKASGQQGIPRRSEVDAFQKKSGSDRSAISP